tara:strand:- start:35974 stop:36138 length:165 start_codon:yes stop_codon:yes gene_type:complete
MVKVIVDEEVLVFDELSDALDNVLSWENAIMIDKKERIVYFYDSAGALFHEENL